jgi:fatty-acyl-CoA synthase
VSDSNFRLLGRALRLLPDLVRSGPGRRFTSADLLERQARRRPDAPFVRFEGRTQTYGELDAQANRIAHWALARGLSRGDVVALLMENRPEYIAVWMGLAKAGVTTALLNTNLRGEALAHSLRTAGCATAVIGTECAEAWQSLGADAPALDLFALADPGRPARELPPHAKSLDEEVAGFSRHAPPRSVRAALRGGDPLFYIYTSGTTGLPKAARFSHSRFVSAGSYALLAGLSQQDVLYCALPLFHTVGGVMCVNAALRSGATLALARRFSARRFWDDVAESGATAFQYIGELCRYLVNQPPHPKERAHALRFAVGNGLRPDVWETFQRRFAVPRIVEFYGATESNVSMVNLAGRAGSVGRAAPGTKIALVRFDVDRDAPVRDTAGRCVPCADGEPGELLGRIAEGGRTAAGRFEGYTQKEATEKKILRDVFAPGDAWFRTGDLLSRDADGFYYFVDRIGDTFRWKGENVSTQQVAEVIGGEPGVAMCAAYGVALPGAEGRTGMAAVVLDPGASLDGASLYAHAERELPAYARPAFVRVWETPDVTGTFKLRKVELQKQGFDPAATSDPIYYRDDAGRAYQRLDASIHELVVCGALRF